MQQCHSSADVPARLREVRPAADRPVAHALSADATAADHLLVRAPVVSASALAREACDVARSTPNGGYVYAVTEHGELAGVLTLTALLALEQDEPIAPHLVSVATSVRADEDQEHAALAAIRYGLAELPVVDENARFLGVIPASALLRVLHHEHIEDIDRLAGILRRTEHAAHVLEERPSRRVRERLPWLLVGLAGSALATWIVASFEASLQRRVAVAFFMPGIVYLADAIGTQTEAVAVRGLSFRQRNGALLFADELRTGFWLGLALAVPVLPAIWLTLGDFRLAAAVALAIVSAGTVATALGFAFPFLLSRLGKDPALGSGPLATVVQDVLSLLAYFAAVRVLLG